MSDPVPSSAIYDATTGGRSVIVITGGSTGDVLTLQGDGTYAPVTPESGGGNSFATIQPAINGTSGTAVVADSSADTLTLDTGCGMAISGNASTDTITLNAFGVVFPPYYSMDATVYYGFSVSSPGTAAVVSGRKYLKAIHIPKRVTITAVALPVFGTAAATAARMGLRNMNQATGEATTLVSDFGAVDTSTSGSKTITGLSVTIDPGWYYLELIASGTPSLPSHTNANNPWKLGYTSGTVAVSIDGIYRAMTYGALPADETGVSQTRFEGTTPFFLLRF